MTYTCYGPKRGWCGIRHATYDTSRSCRTNDGRLQLALGVPEQRSDRETYVYDKLMKALERIEVII